MSYSKKATAIGLTAILFWAAIVGLIRSVSEHLGVLGGGASIYSVAAILLLLIRGWPDLRTFPRSYLVWGTVLFVAYELCLALSIGFSTDAAQTLEVGMVNYLWPTFTVLAAVIFAGRRANLWLLPGLALSLTGIALVLFADRPLDIHSWVDNVQSNPLSYGLALLGAFLWAAYSVVTAQIARGADGVTFFFVIVAITLWIGFFVSGAPSMHFTLPAAVHLLFAALCMGLGYAAWNIGILRGNMILLAGASYFIPVLSAIFAALWLSATLSSRFWLGAILVTIGSVLCWYSTRAKENNRA